MLPDQQTREKEGKPSVHLDRKSSTKIGLQVFSDLNRFWWMAVLLVGLLAVTALISLMPRETLLKQNEESEQKEMQRSAKLVRYAVQAEIDGLDLLAADWANWDDTYKYMEDRNPEFLKTNIEWEALAENSHINVVYLRDNNGQFVWGGQSSDPMPASGDISVPKLNLELVEAFKQLTGTSYHGVIVNEKEGLLIVSAKPILPSNGEGLPIGTLIMGRFLDDNIVKHWAHQTQMDILLHYPAGKDYPWLQQEVLPVIGNQPLLKTTPEDSRLYIPMLDLRGQKWLASIKWSGDAWQHARKIADYAFLAFFITISAGIIVLMIVFLLYMTEVNRTRRKLTRELESRTRELEASEARYRNMIADMEDAVYIYDLDENLQHYNKQAYIRLGYSAEEMAALDPAQVIAEEWRANSRAQTARIAEGANLVYESYHVKKDGTIFPVEVSSQIIHYNGRPCVLSIVRDISARREAEAARAASERLYRIIFQNSPVGIIYVDKEKRIIRVNESMKVVTNTKYFEDRYGQPFTLDIITPDLMMLLEGAIAGEEGLFEGEYQPPPGGPLLNLRILFKPVNSEDPPTDVICMVEDITIRKRDEAQLRQLFTVIEQSPVSVVIADSEGVVQYVNQAFVQVSGYKPEEAKGQRLDTRKLDAHDKTLFEDVKRTINAGEIWHGEYRSQNRKGDLIWERAVIAQVRDAEDRVTNIAVIATEITREKLLEEADRFINSLVFSKALETDLIKLALEKVLYLTNSSMGAVSIHNKIGIHEELVAFNPPESAPCGTNPPDQGHMFFSDKQPWKECTGAGVTASINEFSDYAGVFPSGHLAVNRAIVVPVLATTGEVTALAVVANKKNDYTALDTEIMNYFVDRIWKALMTRRTELALQESQERARVIFEMVQAGIVLIDAENRRIVDANPAALAMFGGNIDDIRGQACHYLLCPAQADACPILDMHQPSDRSERIMLRKDGTALPILKDVTGLRLGDRDYLLESFVDLTERKAMEEELTTAKEAAEAAYNAKTMFLASMSHEIRTPLNAILGYAQLMKREAGLSSDQQHRLEIIEGSGTHLLRIINDILDMARLEAGHTRLNETICDFDRMLKDIENMFRLRVAEHGIVFSVERRNLKASVMIFDEGKVRQVLVNLIGNAVKFTERGRITVRLTQVPVLDDLSDIILEDGDEFLNIIEVEDTGKGIPLAKHGQIFGVFEQAHDDNAPEGGTGLGLAISRSYAELLGGELELIESQVDEGSLFRFTFKGRSTQGSMLVEKTAERTVKSIAADGKEWKVLVVDDRETNRELLKQLLGRIGFKVREAADGSEGVELYEAWQPDLILMDLMMPVMDGYEAIARIRQSDGGNNASIIAISASVLEESEAEARRVGADAFMRKPFRENDLLDQIQLLTGVQFDYTEESLIEAPEEIGKGLPGGQVLNLELLERLKEAVENGDMQELKDLIDNVAILDGKLAEQMYKMAENYDYVALMKVLGQVEEGDS